MVWKSLNFKQIQLDNIMNSQYDIQLEYSS